MSLTDLENSWQYPLINYLDHSEVFHQDDSSGVLVEVTKASSSLAFVKAIFNQATSAFREPFRTQIMLLSLKHETALLVEVGTLHVVPIFCSLTIFLNVDMYLRFEFKIWIIWSKVSERMSCNESKKN